MGRWTVVSGLAAALCFAAVEGADAQRRHQEPSFDHGDAYPAAWIGLNFFAVNPVGDFGRLVDSGVGVALEAGFPVTRDGALSLKLDGGFIIYGRERTFLCFDTPIGCRIATDLVTTNDIAYVGIGPELAVPRGSIRPYVNGTFGFSYFFTRSSLDDDYDEPFLETTHLSDFVDSYKVGAGVRTRLKGGSTPIMLDMGVQYHRNGLTEYLREGDIVDHPDGSLTIFPNRTEANLVTYRLGVSIGIPGGRGRRH